MTTIAKPRINRADIEQRLLAYLMTQGVAHSDGTPPSNVPIASNGGLDSLGIVQLSMFAGEEFGVEFADDDFVAENFETVGSVARLIETRHTG